MMNWNAPYSVGKFTWTDALRQELIEEIERQPKIWLKESGNFNNMDYRMACKITQKLCANARGIFRPEVDDIRSEWKAISDECVRVLSPKYRIPTAEASVWRFSDTLRFMVYAVTETTQGNAYVLVYLFESQAFRVIPERDIAGVLWPNAKVRVTTKENVEKAVVIAIGELGVMNAKCEKMQLEPIPDVFRRKESTRASTTTWHSRQPRMFMFFDDSGRLFREDDGFVYCSKRSREMDIGENGPIEIPSQLGDAMTAHKIKFSSTLRLDLDNPRLPGAKNAYESLSPTRSPTGSDREKALNDAESELFRNRPTPILGYRGPNRHLRALAAFAEKNRALDPTFPVGCPSGSTFPTRLARKMAISLSQCRRLFDKLEDIQREAAQLKLAVYDVKMCVDNHIKDISAQVKDLFGLFAGSATVATTSRPVATETAATSKVPRKAAAVQTDGLNMEDRFISAGKTYNDNVYKYCPKETVDSLANTSSHPTVFVRRLVRHIFNREQISVLFTEDGIVRDGNKRIRWLKEMILMYYPHISPVPMWQACLETLAAMAAYENLLLKVERSTRIRGSSELERKRMRMDENEASSSGTNSKRGDTSAEQPEQNYLFSYTLLRIAREQPSAHMFAVKIAAILFNGDDDIFRPCAKKKDQAKLNWLKEKVQELYPKDNPTFQTVQWNQCLDALDAEAKRIKESLIKEFGPNIEKKQSYVNGYGYDDDDDDDDEDY